MTEASGAVIAEAKPLIEARGVRVEFGGRGGILRRRSPVVAVDGVDLDILKGRTVGLVGESGSGKSTLGKAILHLNRMSAGSITFAGQDLDGLAPRDLRSLRRRMQIVHQDPYGSLDPRFTVEALVREPLRIHRVDASAQEGQVAQALADVGLRPELAARLPHELSGGQQQRVALARAIVTNPDFIVADEAVSALDVSIQAQVLNVFADIKEQRELTLLFISHDLAVVKHVSDIVAVMYLGQIVELADAESVYSAPRHPYTALLMASILEPGLDESRRRRARVLTSGEIGSTSRARLAATASTGCRFRNRCWLYQELGEPEICGQKEPELDDSVAGHSSRCFFASEVALRI